MQADRWADQIAHRLVRIAADQAQPGMRVSCQDQRQDVVDEPLRGIDIRHPRKAGDEQDVLVLGC